MLLKLAGKEILYWVISRTLKSKLIDKIVVSIPTKDKKLIRIIEKLNVDIMFGDEFNVLDRYYKVGQKYSFQNMLRICADNPFIDQLQ